MKWKYGLVIPIDFEFLLLSYNLVNSYVHWKLFELDQNIIRSMKMISEE